MRKPTNPVDSAERVGRSRRVHDVGVGLGRLSGSEDGVRPPWSSPAPPGARAAVRPPPPAGAHPSRLAATGPRTLGWRSFWAGAHRFAARFRRHWDAPLPRSAFPPRNTTGHAAGRTPNT